jgi:hypothetical protein
MATDKTPFREKYFDEAFYPWHVMPERNGYSLINANGFFGPVPTQDAEELVRQYERIRKALLEAVKYDYERFTELRDM